MAYHYHDGNHPGESLDSVTSAKAAVQDMLDTFLYIANKQSYQGFDWPLMNNLRLLTASSDPLNNHQHPSALFELYISSDFGNLNGVLHGAGACVIFDMTTTMALCPIQKELYWDFMGGVSRTMNISYLKGLTPGMKVRVRTWVVQHGRTMALLRGQIESEDGKTIYASVEQHKVNVPSLEGHLKLREELRKAKKENDKAKL